MSANNIQNKIKKLDQMPEGQYKKLVALCYEQASFDNDRPVYTYIMRTAQKYGPQTDSVGNIFIRKGTDSTFPVFTAHIDTVHDWAENLKLYTYILHDHRYLYAENGNKAHGIGGDDKCGIFACLYLLETLENVAVIFFTGEESGCTGSGGFDMKKIAGARFICSIDRWGNNDIISSYCGEKTISDKMRKTLAPIIKKHDYRHTSGLITDCFTLMHRGAGVSCFNISCGYYAHHSKDEYIDCNELWDCCVLCENIANVCTETYRHDTIKPVKRRSVPVCDYSRYDYSKYDQPYTQKESRVKSTSGNTRSIIEYVMDNLDYTINDLFFEEAMDDLTDAVNEYMDDCLYETITRDDIIKYRDEKCFL